MEIQSFLDNLIFLNLLLVTIVYWASLIYSNFKFLTKVGIYGNFFANFLIFTLLGLRWVNFGYFPLSNLYESLLFLAWGISFITLIIEDRSLISFIGSITIALFVTGLQFIFTRKYASSHSTCSSIKIKLLMMHVTVMMLI